MSISTLFPVARHAQPLTALLLTGGGARAAYQVGVLQALSVLRRAHNAHHAPNPFGILAGTSAGSINATALACTADHFDLGIHQLVRHWLSLDTAGVYRSDHRSLLRTAMRWLRMLAWGWLVPRYRPNWPQALLDNGPLYDRLRELLPMERIPMLLEQGYLHAVAVTASSYTTGEHITFYDTRQPIEPWQRTQRSARLTRLTHSHLLASSAIPFVFPAVALPADAPTEYFGDGSIRQTAPLSPVIHLGAERVVVIGAGRVQTGQKLPPGGVAGYPGLAQVAGHTMASIFLDALPLDVERMQRINRTINLIPEQERARSHLRPLELLVIDPSERLDTLAMQHMDSMPQGMRKLLGSWGVQKNTAQPQGAALASYLMFTPPYIRALMALGHADTLRRSDEVVGFFGWDTYCAPAQSAQHTSPSASSASL